MLVQLQKVNIVNEGYKRGVSFDKIYVNPAHVISIRDYSGVNQFLLQEGHHDHASQKYSLIKMNNIKGIEEVIVLGTSREIFESFNSKTESKGLLNG